MKILHFCEESGLFTLQNYKKGCNFATKSKAIMRYLLHLVSHYPLSSFLILVIWLLCFWLIPPHTPLNDVAFIDKWTHLVMYLGTGIVIWWEYLRRHEKVSWSKALLGAWIGPTIMSGLIEILQAYCTGGRRSGEWLDFAANATGATLALLIGILAARLLSKA